MNAPIDATASATAQADLEYALRVALQALEARWPRHFDAACRRDTDAVQVVTAALEAIEAGKRAAANAADNVVTTETSTVVVRPSSATREVTLSIHPKGPANPQAPEKASLMLSAATARQLGALLLASGQALAEADQAEGGAA